MSVRDKHAPLQVERVYEAIKTRVIYGHYRPGHPMSESVLARVLHASRTPVREALSRLGEEGYVQRVPRRGYRVAPLTRTTIAQVFQVRKLLEMEGAALAAVNATDEMIQTMQDTSAYPTLDEGEESYHERLRGNERFHLAVAQGSGNQFLVDLVRQCLLHHSRVLSLAMERPVLPNTPTQHQAIVDAIRRHDPDEARALMCQHLEDADRLVMQAVDQNRIRGIMDT
jgi:DNA-binding GntR family transcriptional regulator